MTDYSDVKKRIYVVFVREPGPYGTRFRELNQVQVIYDEGTVGEVSGWEQTPLTLDPLVNPSGDLEAIFDGIRVYDFVPANDGFLLTRIT